MGVLLLLRHAETDAVGRWLAGRRPGEHLNARGRRQAERLAARLAARPIHALYASPRERTRETAQPLAARLGLEVRVLPELDEIDFGAWTGRTFESLAGDERWREAHACRARGRAPGGESLLDAQARMVAVVEELHARHAHETIAVFGHADPLRLVLAHHLGLALDLLERLDVAPASLHTLDLSNAVPVVRGINDRAHLEEDVALTAADAGRAGGAGAR